MKTISDTLKTAFIRAAEIGDHAILKELLDQGIDVNVHNEQGQNALMIAARNGYNQCLRLLLEAGAELDCQDMEGNSALHFAAKSKNFLGLALLLQAGATINGDVSYLKGCLIWAIEKNNSGFLQLFLDAGANPNEKDYFGRTALTLATKEGNAKIVRQLLNAGASPYNTKINRSHLVADACESDTIISARLLLAAGAPLNNKVHYINTAICKAALNGNADIFQTLLIWGAEIPPQVAERISDSAQNDPVARELMYLINNQAALRHQFELLDYSDFMNNLYSSRVSEEVLCQTLLSRDFDHHSAEYVTPEGVHVIRASAILNKPKLLLTSALLAADGDVLVAADILAKQKQTLPNKNQPVIDKSLAVFKHAQKLINQYHPLAASTGISAGATLSYELFQHQVLPKLLKPLASGELPLEDILIEKIINRTAALYHLQRQAKAGCTTAFGELVKTHPARLESLEDAQLKLSQPISLQAPCQITIFRDQPLSTLPASTLWQHALSKRDPKQKLALLFQVLRQADSAWLPAAMPMVLSYTLQCLQANTCTFDAAWFALYLKHLMILPVVAREIEHSKSLSESLSTLRFAITESGTDEQLIDATYTPATAENPNRFFVVAERTKPRAVIETEEEDASSEHDAAGRPMP